MNINNFKNGISHGFPIALGYFGTSLAFGISSVNQGMKIWQTVLISMFNETSAGQLAAIPIIVSSGTLIELAVAQLIINLRYFPMSISLSQKFDDTMNTIERLIVGFSVTDEIFAVAMTQKKLVGKSYLYGLIITPWIGWSLGTLIGAILGDTVPSIVSSSLGIAIYGMFVAIVLPVAKKEKSILYCVILSVALSLCFNYLPLLNTISSGFVIIICAVIASAVMAYFAPVKEIDENE